MPYLHSGFLPGKEFASVVCSVSILLSGLIASTAQTAAADFFCSSGDVTCLIASIKAANARRGKHIITLEPGTYILRAVDNTTEGNNALPSISGSIRIQPSSKHLPTVIEPESMSFPFLRMMHVSATGDLTVDGLTFQRGSFIQGSVIFNRGITTLYETLLTNNAGEGGMLQNSGTLKIVKTIIADNSGGHEGAIVNRAGATIIIQDSTLMENHGIGPGAIGNYGGSVVVKNSAFVSNRTDRVQPGGAIGNFGGSVRLTNTTIAKNQGGIVGGGLINSEGFMSIVNSTIRENHARFGAGGIAGGGLVQIQNTIVADNTLSEEFSFGTRDCSGTITSLGNNLIGDVIGCTIDLKPTDLTGDPGLGALVGHGEEDPPGLAHYPVLAGSPVIDQANPTTCPAKDQIGNVRLGTCDIGAIEHGTPDGALIIRIDIQPKGKSNKINLKSSKPVSVAILSGDNFDATEADVGTIRFGVAGSEAVPIGQAREKHVDKDRRRDLVLEFYAAEAGIQCGTTSAVLTGTSSDGKPFIGSASFVTTGCN